MIKITKKYKTAFTVMRSTKTIALRVMSKYIKVLGGGIEPKNHVKNENLAY